MIVANPDGAGLGGSGLFLPSDISNLGLELDSSDPNGNGTIWPAGAVSLPWVDKSRVLGNATVGSGVPTYVLNSQNGLPGIQFVATSTQWMQLVYNSLVNNINTSGLTIFAVYKPTTLSSFNSIIATSNTSSSGGWEFGSDGSAINFTTLGNKNYIGNSGTLVANTASVIEQTFDTSFTVNQYNNGTLINTLTNASGMINIGASPQIIIGTRPGGASDYLNGILYALIIYFRLLLSPERYWVRQGLGNRWGIAVS